jgi:hypothetical protein
MAMMSAREFIQDTGRAERLADEEPVFITKRSKVTYVLMSIDEYDKLKGHGRTIPEMLSMNDVDAAQTSFETYLLPRRKVAQVPR